MYYLPVSVGQEFGSGLVRWILALNISWCCSQNVGQSCSLPKVWQRLRFCFQNVSFTWLLTGGLSASPYGPLSMAIGMVVFFHQRVIQESKELQYLFWSNHDGHTLSSLDSLRSDYTGQTCSIQSAHIDSHKGHKHQEDGITAAIWGWHVCWVTDWGCEDITWGHRELVWELSALSRIFSATLLHAPWKSTA